MKLESEYCVLKVNYFNILTIVVIVCALTNKT